MIMTWKLKKEKEFPGTCCQTEVVNMELKEEILISTITAFNRKGLKFTMDDIARGTGISKKTIYTVFEDKEALFLSMVDYLFDKIKEEEEQILSHDEWNTVMKLRRILSVMPESYKEIDFSQLFVLKEKYPNIYRQVELRLENGWEGTIALLEQGMKEGMIRKISIPLFKMMFESALEQFFSRDILQQNGMGYAQALDEVVGILVEGIVK